jgi:deoxyribonuclease V
MHLFNALKREIPIIGVAKNAFHDTPSECSITRGQSAKALFVSAVGVDLEIAKNHIVEMHGEFRMPTLLKLVDGICRRRE